MRPCVCRKRLKMKKNKSPYAYSVINELFDAMLRGKELTEKEIENTIYEIMETVSKVADEYGEKV